MCDDRWSYVMRTCRHCGVEFTYRFRAADRDAYIHAGLKVELALETHRCPQKAEAEPRMKWWRRLFPEPA